TPSGSRSIHLLAGTGASFGASTLQQEIGLGDAIAVRQIAVQWPSGLQQTFANVAFDRKYLVSEGAEALQEVVLQQIQLARTTRGDHRH
ncbi:MAG: ASPIC/UnbV domain-containing protein, partial [Candidatus Latescibacteria bacterium]|nr:ASPIC/UnbV domain-containing protein [Candidatus Latescibacterota bacterium]